MEKADYDARRHAIYVAGRQMSPEALETWTDAFGRHALRADELLRPDA